jgi:hypothetical protein
MRKWLKVIALVCILALISYGGFEIYSVGHSKGYSEGEIAGYDNGYSIGQEAGYSSGEQEGYSSGRTDGYSLGHQEGYDEGYSSGRTDGYSEGMEAGLGHGYTLKDPTYEQVITFLKEDKTDRNEYVKDTYGVYVCSHFARDVCNNAEAEGLRCAFVELRYPDGGHSIIAFNTIDAGLVYFEAQTDERARPVIGQRYYQCIEPSPGCHYDPPWHDDTIKDILVIW